MEWYMVVCGYENGHLNMFKRYWNMCSKYINHSRLNDQYHDWET